MTLGEFRELTKDMPEDAVLKTYQAAYCSGYKKIAEVELLEDGTIELS